MPEPQLLIRLGLFTLVTPDATSFARFAPSIRHREAARQFSIALIIILTLGTLAVVKREEAHRSGAGLGRRVGSFGPTLELNLAWTGTPRRRRAPAHRSQAARV